jgi:hypothetical protein
MDSWQRDRDVPPPECPTCGAADAHHVALVPPVVYVRCDQCETAWRIRDRRSMHRFDPRRWADSILKVNRRKKGRGHGTLDSNGFPRRPDINNFRGKLMACA